MTKSEAQNILRNPKRKEVLDAISEVSLSEKEYMVVVLRYLHGLTQQDTAERMPYYFAEMLGIPIERAIEKYSYSLNSVQNWESSALKKCAEVWK